MLDGQADALNHLAAAYTKAGSSELARSACGRLLVLLRHFGYADDSRDVSEVRALLVSLTPPG